MSFYCKMDILGCDLFSKSSFPELQHLKPQWTPVSQILQTRKVQRNIVHTHETFFFLIPVQIPKFPKMQNMSG